MLLRVFLAESQFSVRGGMTANHYLFVISFSAGHCVYYLFPICVFIVVVFMCSYPYHGFIRFW